MHTENEERTSPRGNQKGASTALPIKLSQSYVRVLALDKQIASHPNAKDEEVLAGVNATKSQRQIIQLAIVLALVKCVLFNK